MTDIGTTGTALQARITKFVVERASYYLDLPDSAVDVDRPLGDYGVDSVYLLSIVTDLEEELDVELDPAKLAEVRTVRELATRVADEVPE
ncbi:acyl carrier protein [Amycolatopsis sp. NPDC005003]